MKTGAPTRRYVSMYTQMTSTNKTTNAPKTVHLQNVNLNMATHKYLRVDAKTVQTIQQLVFC